MLPRYFLSARFVFLANIVSKFLLWRLYIHPSDHAHSSQRLSTESQPPQPLERKSSKAMLGVLKEQKVKKLRRHQAIVFASYSDAILFCVLMVPLVFTDLGDHDEALLERQARLERSVLVSRAGALISRCLGGS
jgi:hypothetical protein